MENDMCGMETYLDTGCKIRITFDNGATLTGRVLCVEYGDIPKENDMIIIEVEDGRLYAAIADRITDIDRNSRQNNGYRNRIGKKRTGRGKPEKANHAPRLCGCCYGFVTQ